MYQVRSEDGDEEMMIEEEAREKFEKTLISVQSNFDTVIFTRMYSLHHRNNVAHFN